MKYKKILLSALLLIFITLEILIAFNFVAKQKSIRESRTEIYASLIELQNQIGYAGLIHNFKNAILRPGELNYRNNAFENYRIANILLNEFELQGALILGELKMQETRDMLSAYNAHLLLLPELINKEMSTHELDRYLRYDDEPSHIEITLAYNKISLTLESLMTDLVDRSLKLSLIFLIALLITLATIVRFFFKEQQEKLNKSTILNNEMETQKIEMTRSQSALVSIMKDLKKEKRQANMLNEKLSNKNKEMEQFIYTVSHDLKSPLVTISAFTQKLKSELTATLTEKQSYRLTRIIQNVKNMEDLLTDLLDLSRIVQQKITISQINVKTVIEEQCTILEESINESNATINIAENLQTVCANKRLLGEALLNLLSNAIRYREPSVPLIVDISTKSTPSSTIINVTDNGIGIDPKYHELIFAIFERLSTIEGSGVGLTIVKTIMDKHKGQVRIDSALGDGTCFCLEFPNTKSNIEKDKNTIDS
jgi:signal transduction histidine kinase